jgi:uncharacterized protein with HEPN domain
VRGDIDRLLDMVEMCDLLIEHASDSVELARNAVLQAAAQRWIEVLGEAASHVSEEVRSTYPDVPWRNVIGVRTILAHAYFHIDQDIVGDIVATHIPDLRRQLQTIIDRLDGG